MVGLIKKRDLTIRKGAAKLLAKSGSAKEAVTALGAIGPDARAAVPLPKALERECMGRVDKRLAPRAGVAVGPGRGSRGRHWVSVLTVRALRKIEE